jgi:tetratricopeptide (TPR) repeat protein
VGQINAVHFSWHFDVAYDQIKTAIQLLDDLQRLGSTIGFQTLNLFSLQDCSKVRPDRRLVVNNEADPVCHRTLILKDGFSDSTIIDSPRDLYALKSKLEYDRGAHQQAIDDLEHAVRLDPQMAGMLFDEHVLVPPETQSLPCAWTLANLHSLAEEFPKDYRVHLFIALWYDFHGFYGHQDYYAVALASCQKSIAINPKIGLSYYYLGTSIESTMSDAEKFSPSSQPTENDRRRLQAYNTAITLDPTLVPAYTARANIQTYLKHPALALNDYNKAIELHPNDHELYNRRAQLLMDNGKDREAIADFTKAIDNCKDKDWGLQRAYYEQRADVSLRVGEFGEAVKGYSQSIRLILENVIPHMLRLKQFRKLYPEYNGLSDERLSNRLHVLLRPAWDSDVFAKTFMDTTDETLAAVFLSENYAHRGDAYWLSRNYKKAVSDYQRIFDGFPTYIKQYPDTLDRWKRFFVTDRSEEYLDVRTVDYSQRDVVKLWLKTVERKTGKSPTSSLRETNINCASRMIGTFSVTNYDTKGNVIGSVDTAAWQKILPDSLGEALYEGMCRE